MADTGALPDQGVIFHIARAADWDEARRTGRYTTSTLGRSLDDVGFIHCSHRHQVERVANAAYRGLAERLCLLVVDPTRLEGSGVREESGGGVETFPHVYGPLPLASVVEVRPFEPTAAGLFVPPRSWLSSKVEVRPSPIEGLGLFAVAPVGEGEPVSVMGGRLLTDEELADHVATADRWSATSIGGGLNILQDPEDPLALGNHSCPGNVWMVDELTLAARRPIAAGEEITVDYALSPISRRS
ncbi:MAG TPA: DUF952 domain-containing protein [Acidimicrobiales bacterium]|nr:DUF952 domain-containing protein [Acidimicrobiales bacterium]